MRLQPKCQIRILPTTRDSFSPAPITRPDLPAYYRDLIEAALVYTGGTHTLDDVEALIASGAVQFWPAPHSCVVTEFDIQPRQKTLSIFLAAGDLRELEAIEPVLMAWAREQGCTHARFVGRRGWRRTFLARQGWVDTRIVVMEKALDGQESQSRREQGVGDGHPVG